MKIAILITSSILLFFSCEGFYSFESELHTDISLKEKKIVINSFFNDEEWMHVNISVNQPSTDGDTVHFIDNAVVLLYENDVLQDTLTLKSDGSYFSDKVIPEAGIPYKLRVEVPGMNTATTDLSLIPEGVKNFSTDTSTYVEENTGRIYRKVTIKFMDPKEVTNYYLIYMIWEGTRYTYDSDNNIVDSLKTKVAYGWGDGINIPHSGKLLFTDEEMEGDTIEKNLFFRKHMPNSGLGEFDHLIGYFKLCTISEEYYLYAKSYFDQHNSLDWSVFVEPVSVFSNINNGYGIFAGYGQCIDSVFYRD